MNFYIFLFSASITYITASSPYIESYYWRNYNGTTPEDALPGGLDRSGIPIFIGQTLYEGKLIPGKIYLNSKSIQFPWDNEKRLDKNILILCSQHPEYFNWVTTSFNELPKFTNKFVIKGGYENNYATYIGRVFINGETAVGKVICGHADCLGFYVASEGKQVHIQGSFDVLTLDLNLNDPTATSL